MRKAALLAVVLPCLIAPARADIPPLSHQAGKTVPRKIESPLVLAPGTKDDSQMYVRLPRTLLQQWRADASHGGDSPGYAFHSSHGSTVVAGVALTLSLSLAGLWLVRGRQRRVLAGTALTLGALVLLGVSGCPPMRPDARFDFYNEPLAAPVAQADGSLKGEALLQIDEKSSVIQVVVPAKELAVLAQSQSEK
ncbi:MAG TPA: hypothetical protein VN688_08160 [Gemmataceae bacterium]|nr:hypothetical protein [Gemmataceae bacterium]